MKTKHSFLLLLSLMPAHSVSLLAGGIKHAKTQTLKVSGNCGMCKKTIETAAYVKGSSIGIWDESKQVLSLMFDSTKTNPDEVLKRIANFGNDNEKFLAPDKTYAGLHGCCQYDRVGLAMTSTKIKEAEKPMAVTDMEKIQEDKTPAESTNPLAAVFTGYLGLKDALTKDDGVLASTKAKEMFKAIDKVAKDKMTAPQHILWMKLQKDISYDAEHIKGVDETEHQREHFVNLSENIYALARVFKIEAPVYYDHCPMANGGKGAGWLSLEEKITNPYMGKKMPGCGKVKETIK